MTKEEKQRLIDRLRKEIGSGKAWSGICRDAAVDSTAAQDWAQRSGNWDRIHTDQAEMPFIDALQARLDEELTVKRAAETFPPRQADGTINPKDAAALTRVPMHLLPSVGVIYGAMACKDGAEKYGPFNWRERDISLVQYCGALLRHIHSVLDGEDCASDSKLPHLAHVIATASILLDAQAAGALLDDRPKRSGDAAGLIAKLNAELKAKAAK